jgi:hypothetical protein
MNNPTKEELLATIKWLRSKKSDGIVSINDIEALIDWLLGLVTGYAEGIENEQHRN